MSGGSDYDSQSEDEVFLNQNHPIIGAEGMGMGQDNNPFLQIEEGGECMVESDDDE